MAAPRTGLVIFVLCLIAALVAIITATPIQTLAVASNAQADYVLSLCRCQGSKTWTIHGLWPEWGQSYPGHFDLKALDPILPEMQKWWVACPEFGHTESWLWSHEYEKHGTVYVARFNSTQLDYFATTLELRHRLVDRCSPTLTGECRLKLDKDFNPIN